MEPLFTKLPLMLKVLFPRETVAFGSTTKSPTLPETTAELLVPIQVPSVGKTLTLHVLALGALEGLIHLYELPTAVHLYNLMQRTNQNLLTLPINKNKYQHLQLEEAD